MQNQTDSSNCASVQKNADHYRHRIHLALITSIFFLLPQLLCAVETPFFWSEFDTVEDRDRWPNAELVDGNLMLLPDADVITESLGFFSQSVKDAVYRTKTRFLGDPPSGINPWVGIWARNRGDIVYFGGVGTDGLLYIGKAKAPTWIPEIRDTIQIFDFEDLLDHDLNIEVSTIGDHTTARAWLDGEPRPDEWQLDMIDDESESASLFGIGLNPSPELTGVAVRHFAVLPALDGDFDGNGGLGTDDIDILMHAIRTANHNRALDLDGDANGLIDQNDLTQMIHTLFDTYLGDANLDGEFNSIDLVKVFQSGQYEDSGKLNSTWSTGDWNSDGEFSSSDFVVAFQDGGYERGPRRIEIHRVPEPTSNLIAILSITCLLFSAETRNKNSGVDEL